jgi:hypothetical protein
MGVNDGKYNKDDLYPENKYDIKIHTIVLFSFWQCVILFCQCVVGIFLGLKVSHLSYSISQLFFICFYMGYTYRVNLRSD